MNKLLAKSLFFLVFLAAVIWLNAALALLYGAFGAGQNLDGLQIADYALLLLNTLRFNAATIAIFTLFYLAVYALIFRWKKAQIAMNLLAFLAFFALISPTFLLLWFYATFEDGFNATLLSGVLSDATSLSWALVCAFVASLFVFAIYAFFEQKINQIYRYDPLSPLIKTRHALAKNAPLAAVFALSIALFFNIQITTEREMRLDAIKHPFIQLITPGALNDLYRLNGELTLLKQRGLNDYFSGSFKEAIFAFFGDFGDNETDSKNATESMSEPISDPISALDSALLKRVYSDENIEVSNTKNAREQAKIHKDIRRVYYLIVRNLPPLSALPMLKELASTGISMEHFLQNAKSPQKTLDAHILGVLNSEISLGLMSPKPLPTAPAWAFAALGFSTQLYHARDKNYKKLSALSAAQGLSRLWHKGDLDAHVLTMQNNDNYQHTAHGALLDMVLKHSSEPTPKTLNFILLDTAPHIDSMLAKFIKKALGAEKKSLFVIVSVSNQSDFVPFLLYSPSQSIHQLKWVASAVDIAPSLYELLAPTGFAYRSFGSAFASLSPFTYANTRFSLGENIIATERFLFDGKNLRYLVENTERTDDEALARKLFYKSQAARALSFELVKDSIYGNL